MKKKKKKKNLSASPRRGAYKFFKTKALNSINYARLTLGRTHKFIHSYIHVFDSI